MTGPLQGVRLPVVPSSQTTLRHWLEEHPAALVMQPDESADLEEDYDTYGRFERGKSKGDLTRTDPLSWQEKSWVVGVQAGRISKAYDWNRLKKDRVINDRVGDQANVLVLATDGQSFAAFERPAGSAPSGVTRPIPVMTTSTDMRGVRASSAKAPSACAVFRRVGDRRRT